MIFFKRLFTFALGSSTLALVSHATLSLLPSYKLSNSQLNSYFNLTKNIYDVSLNSRVDSNVPKNAPFVYSLLATNLNSFVESHKKHFYNQALFLWANAFLKETNQGSFSSAKVRIFNELVKNKKLDLDPQDSTKWSEQNSLITSSQKEFEEVFFDVFFSDLFINEEQTDFAVPEGAQEKYGDGEYVQKIVDFQRFILESWIKDEKPRSFCKKTWKYDANFDGKNLYKEEKEDKLIKHAPPSQSNYEFPSFETMKEGIKTFNEKGECSEAQILGLTDLAKIEDGKELAAFFDYFVTKDGKEGTNSSTGQTAANKDISDLWDLFSSSEKVGNSEFKLNEKVVKDDQGTLKDKKQNYLLDYRETNFGEATNDKQKKGIYIRTQEGVTFLIESDKEANSNDSKYGNIIKELNKKEGKDALATKLKEFFKEHSSELLGRYLSDDSVKKSGGIFLGKHLDKSFYEMAEHASNFSYTLRNNKRLWQVMTTISKSVSKYEKVKFSAENKPGYQAGMALPIQVERNLNKTSQIKENKWEELGEDNQSNDGLFPVLNKYFNFENKKNLRDIAEKLKRSISQYISSKYAYKKIDKGIGSYFFDDYLIDNIYQDLIKKEGLLAKTTSNILLLNELSFNFFQNKIGDLSEQLLYGMDMEYGTGRENMIKNIKSNIVQVFYGTKYFKEPLEERMNYGGYKYEDPHKLDEKKFCVQKISTAAEELADDEEETTAKTTADDSCKTKRQSNESQLMNKFNNYWLTKNYVFTENGYEISSDEATEYIKFLFALKWLTKDGFQNLKEFAVSQIPSARYGAIVWMDNVSNAKEAAKLEVGKKKDNAKAKQGETTNKEEIDHLTAYFRRTQEDSIFNPFFNKNATAAKSPDALPLETEHISAWASVGEYEKMEMFGFKGFFAEKLNAKSLPKTVSEAIFTKFNKSNPKDNKNYLPTEKEEADISAGIAFGQAFTSGIPELERLIDSFKTQRALAIFFVRLFPQEKDVLSEWLNEISYERPNENLTLPRMKQQAKEIIKRLKTNDKFLKATSRFSGLLQNPGLSESTHTDKPYFIPSEGKADSGYVVYITQVNKYDFEEGFADFVRRIGVRTLMKMTSTLSLEAKANGTASKQLLMEKGLII